jgi:hypothetical protein
VPHSKAVKWIIKRYVQSVPGTKPKVQCSGGSLAATNSPLPDVEDSWSLHDHCIEFVFQAALGNVLQTPVPIVVVVCAEELGTMKDILPGAAIERHPHVVLTADPWRHFRLNKTSSNL